MSKGFNGNVNRPPCSIICPLTYWRLDACYLPAACPLFSITTIFSMHFLETEPLKYNAQFIPLIASNTTPLYFLISSTMSYLRAGRCQVGCRTGEAEERRWSGCCAQDRRGCCVIARIRCRTASQQTRISYRRQVYHRSWKPAKHQLSLTTRIDNSFNVGTELISGNFKNITRR